MSSYSAMHTAMVLEALKEYDFSDISHICEIGGRSRASPKSFVIKI